MSVSRGRATVSYGGEEAAEVVAVAIVVREGALGALEEGEDAAGVGCDGAREVVDEVHRAVEALVAVAGLADVDVLQRQQLVAYRGNLRGGSEIWRSMHETKIQASEYLVHHAAHDVLGGVHRLGEGGVVLRLESDRGLAMVRHEVHHLAQRLRLVRVRGLCELHEQRRSLVEEVDPMGQLGHILGAENESVQHNEGTRGRESSHLAHERRHFSEGDALGDGALPLEGSVDAAVYLRPAGARISFII